MHTVSPGKKIYFLSDFHLGAPSYAASRQRERSIVSFFDGIKADAELVFLVGDMFDFWYEYKTVVPKGYVRLLGKLAELADAGVQLVFFVGNHDMWMRNYFEAELGMRVFYSPQNFVFNGKAFYIAHGDGLGPGDHGYKFLKRIFRNRLSKALFGALPPVLGLGIANFFSRKSREAVGKNEYTFLGPEREWLMIHSKSLLEERHYDYFVYGHRHIPGMHPLAGGSVYVNLGDWIRHYSYASFDGDTMAMHYFKPNN
jgi:UDP-2,3-diacylglucosamine hydrolase